MKGDLLKGYYLFAPVEKEVLGSNSGVERKVKSQHQVLSSYFDCDLVVLPPVEYKGTNMEKILRRLPCYPAWRKWKYQGEFDDADFIYIRQVYHDESFVKYLKSIRWHNPNMKIIYEIPTYPYDGETKWSLSRTPFELKERIARGKLHKYVDRIVTFYGQDRIWKIPCLSLLNGYDFSSVEMPARNETDTIHIMSVSTTAFWHGYDRFLEGLKQYYHNGGKENIVYHYVGNPLEEHVRFIEEFDLSDHVIFHGKLSGETLKEIYRICLLGIDFLGGHRKNFPISSSLKSREYGAYGLPFITSSPVDYLPKDYEYQLILPYDDSPVDIQMVINFYHSIYDKEPCGEVATRIRNYAQERCDMSVTMKPVAEWILYGDKE